MGLLIGMATGLAIVLAEVLEFGLVFSPEWLAVLPTSILTGVLGGVLGVGLVNGLAAEGSTTSVAALIRQSRRHDISLGLACGVTLALPIVLTPLLGGDLGIYLAVGLVSGLSIGLGMPLANTVRGVVALGLVVVIAITLVEEFTRILGGIPASILQQFVGEVPTYWLIVGYITLLTLQLAVEPLLVVLGGPSWPSYRWGTWRGARRRMLPDQLVAFLDWCVQHGLLRISGTAIQFRHRILQDWLAYVSVAKDAPINRS
jgi:hypothetical protein